MLKLEIYDAATDTWRQMASAVYSERMERDFYRRATEIVKRGNLARVRVAE